MRATRILAGALVAAATLLAAGAAPAEVRQLAKSGRWAAHGGAREDGAQVCALVSATADGRGHQFVVDFVKGEGAYVRLIKPTWSMAPGSPSAVAIQFGDGQPWSLNAVGAGPELRGAVDRGAVDAFMRELRAAPDIRVRFTRGIEPAWTLTADGKRQVERAFDRCLRA